MTRFSGSVHPFAAAFPMLPDDELADLAADIEANGQLHPILLSPEGVLLDGRNRLAACERAEVEPRFEAYDGDPLALIMSANVNRRSLSTAQKAAARARVLGPDARYTDKGGTRRWRLGSGQNAESAFSRADQVAFVDCGKIVDHDPALLDRVILGDPIAEVLAEVERQQAEAEAEAKAEQERKDRIAALTAANYMGRVSEGALTVDEAWTLYEKETAAARARAAEILANRRRDFTRLCEGVRRLRSAGGAHFMDDYDPQAHIETDRERETFTTSYLVETAGVLAELIEWSKQ